MEPRLKFKVGKMEIMLFYFKRYEYYLTGATAMLVGVGQLIWFNHDGVEGHLVKIIKKNMFRDPYNSICQVW